MKLLSFIKFLVVSFFGGLASRYESYYYGFDNDLRYFRSQLGRVVRRRNYVDNFKSNFAEISFRVAERFESRRTESTLQSSNSYFEFGVFNGSSSINFWIGINAHSKTKSQEWDLNLFDSFEGMPPTEDQRDKTERLSDGDLRSTGKSHVVERLVKLGMKSSKIRFVEGYYEETLTEELRQEYLLSQKVPFFVNIDCDYYSSTASVLNWLEPLLIEGSVVYFDDLDIYHGNPHKGELRAIFEFNQQNSSRGLTVDQWIDPHGRCYTFWRNV